MGIIKERGIAALNMASEKSQKNQQQPIPPLTLRCYAQLFEASMPQDHLSTRTRHNIGTGSVRVDSNGWMGNELKLNRRWTL